MSPIVIRVRRWRTQCNEREWWAIDFRNPSSSLSVLVKPQIEQPFALWRVRRTLRYNPGGASTVAVMAFLSQLGRSASLYMGITTPRPEQERFFGLLILVSSLAIAVGTVALFLLLVHLILR